MLQICKMPLGLRWSGKFTNRIDYCYVQLMGRMRTYVQIFHFLLPVESEQTRRICLPLNNWQGNLSLKMYRFHLFTSPMSIGFNTSIQIGSHCLEIYSGKNKLWPQMVNAVIIRLWDMGTNRTWIFVVVWNPL